MDHPVWLTSHLAVGVDPPGVADFTRVTTARAAADVVLGGGTALLPVGHLDDGREAMSLMGATPDQIERTVVFGLTGRFPAAPRSGSHESSGDGLGDGDELFPPAPEWNGDPCVDGEPRGA